MPKKIKNSIQSKGMHGAEFVYVAAHQLSTPLASVVWNAEAMSAQGIGHLSKKQRECLREIHHSAQKAEEMVSDLLNVSRLDLGNLAVDPQPVKIKNIVDEVLSELRPKIKKNNLHVRQYYTAETSGVVTDPKLLRMVLQNLLTNAVKYTPAGGKITVSSQKLPPNVLISVSDTGYGIPKKEQVKIFSKLFRADNVKAKEIAGTGLGLYVVKEAVRYLNGKIWFDSAENKGTVFYFTIPIKGTRHKSGIKDMYYA